MTAPVASDQQAGSHQRLVSCYKRKAGRVRGPDRRPEPPDELGGRQQAPIQQLTSSRQFAYRRAGGRVAGALNGVWPMKTCPLMESTGKSCRIWSQMDQERRVGKESRTR